MLRRFYPILRYLPYLVFLAAFLLAFILWHSVTTHPDLPRIASLAMLLFGTADWLLLAFLPRFGLSYGSIELSWFLMLSGRIGYLLVITLPLEGFYLAGLATRSYITEFTAFFIWTLINLLASVLEYYSLYVQRVFMGLRCGYLRLRDIWTDLKFNVILS